MSEDGGVVVFGGPSLPARPTGEWSELLEAVKLRPPARRGDFLTVLPERPAVLVLLDGYFFRVPSVSHKEILYALEEGVRIVGAASMGALRAAEMAPFGMEPAGEIARRYRTGEIEGDDEVALLHDERPPHRSLTTALIEVRIALEERRSESGDRDPESEAGFLEALGALPFWERTRGTLREVGSRLLGDRTTEDLLDRLEERSVKEADARVALRRALEPGASDSRRRPAPVFTGYLEGFLEESLRVPVRGPGPEVSLGDAWRLARLLHPEAATFVAAESRRLGRAAVAREIGVSVSPEERGALASKLEETHRQEFGRPLLPATEYRREAEVLGLSARFEEVFRWRERSASVLACDPEEVPGELDSLRPISQDLIPPGWITRAFSFTPGARPAAEAASTARELRRAFRALRGPVAEAELRSLIGELWETPAGEIREESRRRGLAPTGGREEPSLEAARLVIVAERLPRPLNRYPKWREELLESSLDRCEPAMAIAIA
ncbi:MAG: TfuA-like protein [Thermoanaerobaculia bacterium]|nr:TfuA-like protein [Thermoanaerobaculia bacterium]